MATERTTLRRVPSRAHYDSETLHAIIDDAYICHVAFVDEIGTHCIPTACWREGEHLYIHGSNGSRMLRALAAGAQACVTVSHVDGLVLARSAFSHSMNYRSAMVYGEFEPVEGNDAKRASIEAFMEHILPGRKLDARPASEKELNATTFLRMSLEEAVCKVRTGGPNDDPPDMEWPAWSGVLPLGVQQKPAMPHESCTAEPPRYVTAWSA